MPRAPRAADHADRRGPVAGQSRVPAQHIVPDHQRRPAFSGSGLHQVRGTVPRGPQEVADGMRREAHHLPHSQSPCRGDAVRERALGHHGTHVRIGHGQLRHVPAGERRPQSTIPWDAAPDRCLCEGDGGPPVRQLRARVHDATRLTARWT